VVVARVEVGQVADLVGEHRAAAARPVVRRQPEVVDDQAAPLEEVGQLEDPVGPFEGVIRGELRHRLAAALGGQRVAGPRGLLLLVAQSLVGPLPFLVADDRR
jgi:hypothetical protein